MLDSSGDPMGRDRKLYGTSIDARGQVVVVRMNPHSFILYRSARRLNETPPKPKIPASTYRLRFNRAFTFRDATRGSYLPP